MYEYRIWVKPNTEEYYVFAWCIGQETLAYEPLTDNCIDPSTIENPNFFINYKYSGGTGLLQVKSNDSDAELDGLLTFNYLTFLDDGENPWSIAFPDTIQEIVEFGSWGPYLDSLAGGSLPWHNCSISGLDVVCGFDSFDLDTLLIAYLGSPPFDPDLTY